MNTKFVKTLFESEKEMKARISIYTSTSYSFLRSMIIVLNLTKTFFISKFYLLKILYLSKISEIVAIVQIIMGFR